MDGRTARFSWRDVREGGSFSLIAGVAATCFLVYFVQVASLLYRPTGVDWSVWSPASGVAVAVAARFSHRHVWKVAALFGLATGAASFTVRGDTVLAIGAFAAISSGMWLGSRVLRGRHGLAPQLNDVADLARLFACALVTASVIALVGGAFVSVARGPDAFLTAAVTFLLSHCIGILFVTPIVILRNAKRGAAGRAEAVLISLGLLVVIILVFGVNSGLPLTILVIVPLTAAAVRLAPRTSLSMQLFTAASVWVLTPLGRGPFVAQHLDPRTSAWLVQAFDFSIAFAFLTLTIVVARQKRLADAVQSSEVLFRTAFDSSLLGTAILRKTPHGPVVEQLNTSGRRIVGVVDGQMPDPKEALTEKDFLAFVDVIGRYDEPGEAEWQGMLTLATGRILEISLSRFTSDLDSNKYAIQFLDVTERIRAEDVARADMERAGEVQRALLPHDADPLPGYEVAGGCIPAASVGGDFYDWYPVAGGLGFTLGDVMGKGVGAGMIATTIRAVLRSASRERHASTAVTRASEVFDIQAADAYSFATLFHGRIGADDGTIQFVDAGHGLVIILRADGTAETIGSLDIPLGVISGSAWTERQEVLNPGDMLIAVSDGVLELYDGSLGALNHVADIARSSASAAAFTAIITDLAVRAGAADDDVTVLAIRRMIPVAA